MSWIKYSLLVLVLIAFAAACSKGKKENTEQQPPAVTQQTQQPSAQPASQEPPPEAAVQEPSREVAGPAQSEAARQPQVVRTHKKVAPREGARPVSAGEMVQPAQPNPDVAVPAPAPAAVPTVAQAPPPPPQPRFVTMPSGTALRVRLQEPLDSGVNKPGDTFHAILDQDIRINGNLVAPRGSVAEGKLSQVESSGRISGRASMTLQLISLTVGRQTYPIQTEILSREGESVGKKTGIKTGAGAGLGAIIGAIAGGGKGAAIGAVVGAGAGGATAAATNKKELRFESEQQFDFTLSRNIDVRVQ